MRAKLALAGIALGVATAFGLSCADKPVAGLMIAIQTDLSVTKDFDQIGLYITADGVPILTQTYQIEGGSVRLPSTIAIAPPENENAVIRARVVAFKTDAAKVLREGITTVPRTRLAVLPLPLKWINSGSAKGTEPEFQVNPFAKDRSICPDLQTKNNGLCTTSQFKVEDLDDYSAAEIFGGGEEGKGSCFDTKACFTQSVAVPVDDTTCTVPRLGGATNVAVSTTTGEGEPVGQDTLIVLDETDYTTTATSIALPKTLCDAAGLKAQRKAIFVSSTCETKKTKYPVCGAYTTGTPLGPLADAGALDGSFPDSGTVGEMIGFSEPGIGTISVGGSYIYGIGSDPGDSGAYRVLGYPLSGVDSGAPTFVNLLGAPTPDFESTSLALGPDGGDLGVLRAGAAGGAIELYGVQNGIVLPSPQTASHPLPLNAFTVSPNRLYSVAGSSDGDGGTLYELVSFDKASLSEPLFVQQLPQFTEPISALTYTVGPDLDAGADSGVTTGYLFFATGGTVVRVPSPEGFSLPPDTQYVPATVTKATQISGLLITPDEKIVIGALNPVGNLAILVGDAYSSSSLAKISLLAGNVSAPPHVGPNGSRFYGMVTDGKYVYFAHDAGIDYMAVDGSGVQTRLVTGQGIFSLAVDSKYVYWAAAKVSGSNPQAQGFFRLPLVK